MFGIALSLAEFALVERQPSQAYSYHAVKGMLPRRVISAVHGRETDLVMKLSSSERRRAKDELKRKYLEEFKSHTDYSNEELKELSRVTRKINTRLCK
jgi:hypothetical protein